VLFALGGPRKRGVFAAVAAAVTAALLVPTTGALPAAAADLVFALIEVSKTATPAAPDALIPGEQVAFDIEVSCSSTQTDCISMQVSDAMPAPLTLVSVSPSTRYTVVTTGDSFVATFTTPLDEGGVGLPAGELVTMQVIAAVPTDADASYNGQTVTNTAYVTVDNPESNVQDSADVLLQIPLDLASTIVKTVSPSSVVGLPSTVVNFDLSATNSSNAAVDRLIIEDPAEPASNAFDYLEVTGLSNVVFPAGANRVQVDWFDGSTWTNGTPSATAMLPGNLTLIKGLRLTFSNSGATKIAAGATGSFRIATQTTAAVSSMVGDFAGNNLASSQVTLGVDSNTAVLDDAVFTIRQASVAPGATKDFDPNVIIGGQPTTVTIGGSNGGDFVIDRMTITEPKPGTTSMADQGIAFSAWQLADIQWPTGATGAEVTYLYETTGYGTPESTTTLDTLPAPLPATVLGFIVEFTGTMLPGAYAVLPFEASTSTTVAADITTTNTVTVEVETPAGALATADASDDLTRRSSRVNTTVRKIITPDVIYATPGATALLTLPAEVAPLPPATVNSTVGAKTLVVRDADPAFWAKFDPTAIVSTDVPATSTLTVSTYDGTTWTPLAGATGIVGPTTLSLALPAGIEGLEFTFTPTDPDGVLPPGFNVQPNIRVALRATDRGTGDPIIDPTAVDPVLVPNTAVSEVTNPVATPSFATDDAVASMSLLPVPPGGPGLIGKSWQTDEVLARSNNQARLGIDWGTGGVQYDSVVITDTADDPSAPGWNVANSVFEAFDLVRIPAITPGMDALLQYDAIQSVEFYLDGVGWTAAAGNPCAGTACYGTFPGYTLSQTERDTALGVRFVVIENPNRPEPGSGNPSAPAKNSGVTASVFTDRQLDLIFEVRDDRRSNGDAVLGLTRETIYNTGTFGQVLNSAWVGMRNSSDVVVEEGTASDTILILDRPITVEATKDWSGGPLGVPPVGTDAQYFPMARMVITARNTSVTRVDELSLAEPTNGTTPFDVVNLADIVSITVPGGATLTTVQISRGASVTTYSLSQALALTEVELEDVTGIEVIHTGRIDSNAITTVTLDTRLREVVRGTATLVSAVNSPVDNTVTATVRDAGGTTVVPPGEDNVQIDIASDNTTIENWSYGVIATKDILADTAANVGSPAIQYQDSSRTARITLSGQPTGNVRTTKMVFTDTSASFWNAFNFAGFGPSDGGPVSPAEQVQVDALVGVTYLIGLDNSITTECNGSTDLTACWVLGTPAATLTLPVLGSTPLSDIRGLRFTYTKVDQSSWERPSNPTQYVVFTVERRDNLVEANPSAGTTAVPSTLYGSDPAPGETVAGVYSNAVTVTASGGDTSDPTPVWSATDVDDKQLKFQHLPARVEIKKVPFGAQALGVNIPYQIDVINRGGAHEKDLGSLVVTDTFPVDAQGAQLVIPNDPDTGEPYPVATAFTYTLLNASNQVQAPPTVTAVMSAATIPSQTITFTLVSPATLPKGFTLRINATMQLRAQLETGIDVVNSATVTADQIFDSCDSYHDVSTQNPQTLYVDTCTSDTRVWALPSTPLTIVKGVRGVEAGPLDAAGDPLLDGGGQPFDDLGILKTVAGSIVDCSAPNVSTGVTAEYYRYPCVPITRPGGTEEWANTFVNGGNIPVVKLAAIDVLPRANDRGVIVNEARSSKWTPLLSNLPTLVGGPGDASLEVYYVAATGIATTRCNATDIQAELGMTASSVPAVTTPSCLTGSAADDLPQRNWQLLTQAGIDGDPSLLASIVALKFIVTSPTGIVPGQKLSIIYRSTTAAAPEIAESATGLNRDSIAYNSIAAAALGDDNGTLTPNRFVIEPRKVGVAMATGGVELAKLLDGLNSGASYVQTDYNISLSCTSVGQSFEPMNSNGSLRNPFTITAGSAATLIQGLPLYATCDVSEANYGSVQTVTPTTVTAQAAHTTEYLVYDPHPAFDSSRPPIERSTVTNTYDKASLVIGKTIGANNAVNSSGTPIVYSNFRYRVDCTFYNGVSTVTVVNNLTFGLNDGQTRTIADLPAGASCTVQETSSRGAISTTHVDTTAAGPSAATSGTTTTIVLTADGSGATPTNRVQYTNNFGDGSLTLNKLFAGLAQADYGSGLFQIAVSCTLNTNGSTTNVWSGTLDFSKSTVLTRTITQIAAGAVCVITEPTRGGATSVTLPSNATIVNAGTVSRNVTNTFDYAQLVVSKHVETDAEDQSAAAVILDSPFTVTVSCTFNGSDVYAASYSAGSPMVLTLTHDVPVTLTQLPSGASCTVTETAPAHADSTNIRWITASNPGGTTTSGTTATFTLTRDNPGATNSAVVNNLYGVGSFTVEKQALGGGAAQFGGGPFVIHVLCTAPGGVIAYDGDITLSAATSMSFTSNTIAKGSVCSAQETNFASTGADALVYRNGAGVVFDGTGVSVDGATPKVTIENWYLTGEVSVTKIVSGDAAATFGSGPFEVTLVCERDGIDVTIVNPVRPILDGETETFHNLPRGADCLLTESHTGGATSSVIVRAGSAVTQDAETGWSFTIDEIDASDLTDNQPQDGFEVLNRFDLAQLSVSKTVVSAALDQAGAPISYGPFPVTVECLFDGDLVYATGYSDVSPMQEALADTDVWLLEGLPQGAECTVTETDSKDAVDPSIVTVSGAGAPATTSGTSATVTLAALPATNSADITNPYEVGSLELSKSLAGAGADDWGTEPFTIRVECTLTDGTGIRVVWLEDYVFQVSGGVMAPASVSIDTLPSGAACEIDELLTGGANSSEITIDSVTTSGTTATATIAAGITSDVVVTNTFGLSEIEVTKVRDGLGAALYGAGPFQVSLECTRDVNGATVSVPIPGGDTRDLTADTLPLAYYAEYTGLPLGAECELIETLDGGADSSVIAPGTFTLGAIPTTATVTNTFGDPTVFVRKALSGDGVALYGAGPFEVTLACTREVNGVTVPVAIPGEFPGDPTPDTRELNSVNGYENQFDFLPSFADCELTETSTGGATSASITNPIFQLGSGNSVHELDMDNTFELADLRVAKQVVGTAATDHGAQVFTMELECVLDVSGVETSIPIPGGAERTIKAGEEVVYEDLPAHADCTLTETDNGGANALMLVYNGFPVVGSLITLTPGGSTLALSNVFMLALTGFDASSLIMFGLVLLLGGTAFVAYGELRRRRRA
jgi:hypothetical protein